MATGISCPQCGRINAHDMRFCGNCGMRLALQEAVPATAPVPSINVVASDILVPEMPPVIPVPSVRIESASVVAEPPAILPEAAKVESVPTDPLVRMRERERLLTLFNIQRRRGQMDEAQKTLQLALAYAVEPSEAAPIYELVGDSYMHELKFEQAKVAYKKAFEADPKRVSAEKKIAELALRSVPIAAGEASLAAVMLAGGDVRGLLAADEVREKKNPIVAFLLSSVIAGLGQFYNGQRNKAIIFFVLWAGSFLLLNTVVDSAELTRQATALITGKRIRGASSPSPLPFALLLLCSGTWIYASIDAATTATKGVVRDKGRPKVDKTGWEV